MKQGKILIIDDNLQILNSMKILLGDEFQTVETVRNPNQIPELLWRESWDIILLDMNFSRGNTSGNEGLFWLSEIKKSDTSALIILITAFGDIELAVKGIKLGASDFITKPWDSEKLLITLHNAYDLRRSKQEINALRNSQRQLTEDIDRAYRLIIGPSEAMQNLIDTINKVAGTEANVLILGENGTGKELIAREIHRKSPRSDRIFSAVDVASVSETLFESEMFGHVKGAFTDAKEERTGRIENAHGGTLFLDEIGNLSLSLQAKLLQVIQNHEVIPVGSSKPVPVDIRLIAATNKPIKEMVREQVFREDLYYRLNTIEIEVPPLRERQEDIFELTEFFLKEYSMKYEKPFLKITAKALEKLSRYPWPGNVRELRHSIEKSVILCDKKTIEPEDLFLSKEVSIDPGNEDSLKLSDVEKMAIIKVIEECRGNYSRAAKILDISRTTLYAKLKKYGL